MRLACLCLWIIAGCTNIVTEVVVKDPAAVSVRVANPDAVGAEILPAARAPTEIEIPQGNPPYEPGIMFAASAIRRAGGGITLRCDACVGTPTLDVLTDDGRIYEDRAWESIVPPSGPLLRIYGDTAVIWHIAYPYNLPSGKSVSHHIAFDVDLVTPTSNLVSARRDGGDTHTGGIVLLSAGVATLAGAVALFFVASDSSDRSQGLAFDLLGTLTAIWGATFTVGGISLTVNPPLHQHEWPR